MLDSVRVVDFTHALSGPTATQILGDLGADVIKVEAGNEQRIPRGGSTVDGVAVQFITSNRNKRSIVLNLRAEPGLDAARRLIRSADVVVENFRTGVMERFGLDYPTVAATNPGLVYCSITGYGSAGDLATKAANDIAIQARTGLMSLNGSGDEPVRVPAWPADLTSGIYAALGVLAALEHRHRTGAGQHVEVTMVAVVMSMLSRVYGEYLVDGYLPPRLGSGSDMGTPNGAFPTSDGWITLSAVADSRWARCAQAFGLGHLLDDPRFTTKADRRRNRDALIPLIAAATSKLTKREAEMLLEAHGVSCSPIYTVAEVAGDPELRHNFVDVPVSGGSSALSVGFPVTFSGTPATVRRPVPQLGENGREILRELAFSDNEIDAILGASREVE